MTTQPHRMSEASGIYAALMEEARTRLETLRRAVDGDLGLPPFAVHDFGYLQLRLLCEIIALGCLVAHGDIAAARPLRKAYEADRIVRQLGKLHPGFYPVPAFRTVRPSQA